MDKIENYYTDFYGKTFYNMSDAPERINYNNVYVTHEDKLYYVYKLEWGSHYNYIGCTGNPPHKRFKTPCSVRGLDESKAKMTLLESFWDKEDALEYEEKEIRKHRHMRGNQNG